MFQQDDNDDLLSAALSEAGIDGLLQQDEQYDSTAKACKDAKKSNEKLSNGGSKQDIKEGDNEMKKDSRLPGTAKALQQSARPSVSIFASPSHGPGRFRPSFGDTGKVRFVATNPAPGSSRCRMVIKKPTVISKSLAPVAESSIQSDGVRFCQESPGNRPNLTIPRHVTDGFRKSPSCPAFRLSSNQQYAGLSTADSQMFMNQGASVRMAVSRGIEAPKRLIDYRRGNMLRVARGIHDGRMSTPRLNSQAAEREEKIDVNNEEIEDIGQEEDFELSHADTYAEYAPCRLRSGLPHPDPVVETSSLASVQPPEIWYHVSIPEDIIDTGRLSALQLETIIYACQQHETLLPSGERTGYLIGDGPGVGKGRTIAGIIYENYLLGRKRSVWFSVSSDLKFDAQRDLIDVGADKIKVHALNKFKYSKISGKENGSIKKGVIFATYASLIGESQNCKSKYRTRIKQLLHWCGSQFDGVIVLDECHRAKNLVPSGSCRPTKTGQTVMALQNALPKARIVYASATGATEPKHMAYMTRLGLWGTGRSFPDFSSFISAVERRGVGAMEVIAMDMKLRGLYLARQLSFSGVGFRIEEVTLSTDFIHMYDESVKLWLEARRQFQAVSELMVADKNQRKAMWGQFWASHQRFFKYLCIAAKVKTCVRLARESVRNGKCVVIGLQSTGEARTLEQLDGYSGELTDFVSTAKGVFQALIEKHFPSGENSFVATSVVDLKRVHNAGHHSFMSAQNQPDQILSESESSDLSLTEDEDDLHEHSEGKEPAASDGDIVADEFSETESDISIVSSDQEESISSADDLNDSVNPFMLDENNDPWEEKMMSGNSGRKSQKRKRSKFNLKSELEKCFDEPKEKKQSVVGENEVNAHEFLHSGSTFLAPDFTPLHCTSALGFSQVQVVKADLLAAIERLGEILPPNTLDELINELGGPQNVAEMTGRKGRIVSTDNGGVIYQLRNDGDVPVDMMNMTEKERFMNGTKRIAIISEAASSGISLHADRRAKNQRRRVHITLELPWSADKAVQQFGRTHRSNQVNSPEYIFLISELAGEQRFASIVAKRLESLGALTHGDRRATESRDLSQFNLDTKYGRSALEICVKSILGWTKPLVKPPADYKGNFFKDMLQFMEGVGLVYQELTKKTCQIEKDINMTKFLNRILGLPVSAQNSLFQYFSDTLKEVVEEAKREGRYDLGIMDLGQQQEKVKKLETNTYVGKMNSSGMKTELHKVSVERGMLWNEAMDIYCQHMGDEDGFYMTKNPRLKPTVALVCAVRSRRSTSGDQMYNIYKPYCSVNSKPESLTLIKQRYRKVLPKEAEPVWKEMYESSGVNCQHFYWFGKCRGQESGGSCEVGKRLRNFHILSGSVVAAWSLVEKVMALYPSRQQQRMQVVRLRTDVGQKLVGLMIPNMCVPSLMKKLEENSTQVFKETFS